MFFLFPELDRCNSIILLLLIDHKVIVGEVETVLQILTEPNK